ncbi:MAG: hypothetical protein GF346_07385 [Candidatus Eisenbacteria bacterium]|nr:hypothetical protein [Candidatus Latescibacterota bacterium]MBD3302254.1 hypothetical protein [Candidatus Eisenbacteria bacterium]
MRRIDDDYRGKRFQLRPGHAFLLIDLAILAGLFYLGGRLYMQHRGDEVVAEKKAERAAAQIEGVGLIAEADSVVAATELKRQEALQDSVEALQELKVLRENLQQRVQETQQLNQGIYRLSDIVLDMRGKAEDAVRDAQRKARFVEERRVEIDSLETKESQTHKSLVQTRQELDAAEQALLAARQQEEYDPTSRFPKSTALAVRRDVGDELDLTNLLLEHVVWQRGPTDLGLSVGFGLGTNQETNSNKEVGLLLSRSLIHRRLGLDVGAGFSQLTFREGEDENDAYASASLRISPFYQEHLHLGIGARTSHDEVVPFLGVTVGRR